MNKKRRSQKQEKSVAKELNAKVQIASGAFWGNKADVRSKMFLIECKTTSKDYFNLTNKIWEKISLEAMRDKLRIPLLIVDLRDSERYVIFNPQDFDEIDFEYDVVNSRENCNTQFRFKDIENPISFYIKASGVSLKQFLYLMAMPIEDFKNCIDFEI